MFNHQFFGLGADPEVFLVHKNGHPQSAEGLLPGTKNAPAQMEGLPEGFMIQVDNVAAEYNVPPARTPEDFDRNIMLGLRGVHKYAAKLKLKVAIQDVMHFPPEQLNTPHAQTLGCEPDFNIWERDVNPRPAPPGDWRTAAGHVHIAWSKPDDASAIAVGCMADLFLGVPALLVTQPSLRRKLYGKAGAWRFKPYGGEYRSLPNFWIATSAYRKAVFRHVAEGFRRLHLEQDFLIEQMQEYSQEIQHTINTHDLDGALMLIEKFSLPTFPTKQDKNANV